MQLSELRLD